MPLLLRPAARALSMGGALQVQAGLRVLIDGYQPRYQPRCRPWKRRLWNRSLPCLKGRASNVRR